MKKNLYTLMISLGLCSAATLTARDITPDEAAQIANSFFREQRVSPRFVQKGSSVINLAYTGKVADAVTTDQRTPYYVFNYGNDAFVLVSGDDRMMPVLGYSDAGSFSGENIPDNVASWLEMYAEEYAYLQNCNSEEVRTLATTTQSTYPTSVSPLLGDIAWNQDAPYNNLCPKVGTKATYTGCVATAMAMIMKYHAYPNTSVIDSTKTYTTTTQKLSVSYDFSQVPEWDNMLPTYNSGSYTTTQATAVANLMLGCGVAVDMDYNTTASGAVSATVTNALANLYKYDSNIQHVKRDVFGYAEWLALIKTELSNNRPIFYSGRTTSAGHAFVFDGYDASDMMHVNWGWGGSYNGYFRLTGLHPEQVGIGGGNGDVEGFNYSQGMIVGIQKPNDASEFISGFTVDSIIPSQTSFKRSSKFTLKLTKLTNYGTNFSGGELAVVLEKDGTQTAIKTQSFSKLNSYYLYPSLSISSISVPTTLENGVYSLYVGLRPKNSQQAWSRVRCENYSTGIWRATVSSSTVTLSDYWGDFNVSATLTVGEALYPGMETAFNVVYSNLNTQSEVYSSAGVAFINSATSATSVFDVGQLYLAAGASNESIDYTITLPDTLSVGTYSVIPVVAYGDTWKQVGSAVTAEVKSATISSSDSNLQTPIAITFGSNTISEGDPIVLSFTLKNKSTTNVYQNKIGIYIYNSSSNKSVAAYSTSSITVGAGSSKTLSYSLTPTLEVGEYFVMLRGYSGWLNTTKAASFTVSSATSIADVSSDRTDTPVSIYLSQADALRITGTAHLLRAEVYDLSGRLALSIPLTGEAEQTVSTATLSAGSYVVRLQTAGGVVVNRFVKP